MLRPLSTQAKPLGSCFIFLLLVFRYVTLRSFTFHVQQQQQPISPNLCGLHIKLGDVTRCILIDRPHTKFVFLRLMHRPCLNNWTLRSTLVLYSTVPTTATCFSLVPVSCEKLSDKNILFRCTIRHFSLEVYNKSKSQQVKKDATRWKRYIEAGQHR